MGANGVSRDWTGGAQCRNEYRAELQMEGLQEIKKYRGRWKKFKNSEHIYDELPTLD